METYSKRTDEGRVYAEVIIMKGDFKFKVIVKKNGAKVRQSYFRDNKDLWDYLYRNAFHLIVTDRRCVVFAREIQTYGDPEKIKEMTYSLFKEQEVAYQQDGILYTGWPVALEGEQVTLRSNTDFATEAKNGINYVTIDFNELILLGGL